MKYDFKELENTAQNFRNGDEKAFIKLYEKTYQQTYFLAYSMLKNKEITLNAVQEVFTNVQLNLPNLIFDDTFIIWLNKLTYTTCLKISDKSKFNYSNDLQDSKKVPKNLTMSMLKSQKEVLSEIMNELDLPIKVSLILKYYHHFKIKEIAKIMNCTEVTVRSRLRIAKKTTKKQIVIRQNNNLLLRCFTLLPMRDALSLYAQQNSMDPVFASEILTSSIGLIAISGSINFVPSKPKPSISTSTALFASLVGGGIIIGTTIAITFIVLSPKLLAPTIITPLVNYTNKPITISVGIDGSTKLISKLYASSGNQSIFKPITISDDEALFSISENGNYIFYLENTNNTTSTAEIVITCIDTKPPTIEDYFVEDNVLTIIFIDDLSGVNISTAHGIDFNENKILPYAFENNSIKFELIPINKEFKLYIEDMSGNFSRFNIAIENK